MKMVMGVVVVVGLVSGCGWCDGDLAQTIALQRQAYAAEEANRIAVGRSLIMPVAVDACTYRVIRDPKSGKVAVYYGVSPIYVRDCGEAKYRGED